MLHDISFTCSKGQEVRKRLQKDAHTGAHSPCSEDNPRFGIRFHFIKQLSDQFILEQLAVRMVIWMVSVVEPLADPLITPHEFKVTIILHHFDT